MAKKAANPDYTIGTWNGHPNYVCGHCEFPTTEAGLFADHMRLIHQVTLEPGWNAEAVQTSEAYFAELAAAEAVKAQTNEGGVL